ncbi:hypothetical protein [Rhodobacter sp. NSM]
MKRLSFTLAATMLVLGLATPSYAMPLDMPHLTWPDSCTNCGR